jgi:hypothetical protein
VFIGPGRRTRHALMVVRVVAGFISSACR